MNNESKICNSCGRSFEKRKKWNDCWEEIRYCSKACQKNKIPKLMMSKIMRLLECRDSNCSICPSEVLENEQKQNKDLMEMVRKAARLLAHEGKIVIMQKGKVINPDDFKGPIRLKIRNNH